MKQYAVKGILFGVAVADALGVSVEFTGREELRKNPVTGMRSSTWVVRPALPSTTCNPAGFNKASW